MQLRLHGQKAHEKVPQNGTVASHERYLYRGYLQIAALNMLDNRNVLRHCCGILWNRWPPAPGPRAGRFPYCYGVDFNKNVSEVFDAQGTIAAAYDYSPYGQAASTGSLVQPVHLWDIKSSNVAELMHTTAGILIIIFLQLISLLE